MDNEMVERCVKELSKLLPGLEPNAMQSKIIVLTIIKAMREPTEKMKSAGGMMLPDYDPSNEDAATCWQNMIDAITGDE